MTAEPAAVPQPGHPVPALTTSELRDYRCELERVLTTLPGHAPVRGLLQDKLTEVLAEQESRARIAGTSTGDDRPAGQRGRPARPGRSALSRTGRVCARQLGTTSPAGAQMPRSPIAERTLLPDDRHTSRRPARPAAARSGRGLTTPVSRGPGRAVRVAVPREADRRGSGKYGRCRTVPARAPPGSWLASPAAGLPAGTVLLVRAPPMLAQKVIMTMRLRTSRIPVPHRSPAEKSSQLVFLPGTRGN